MSETVTAMNRQVDSLRPTNPGWGFGTGSRAAQAKVFVSKEHSKCAVSNEGPGPIYKVPQLSKGTAWPFGTSGLLDKPTQRYPEPVSDLMVNVIDSNVFRYPNVKSMVFGTAERDAQQNLSCAPGPTKYSPRAEINSTVKQSPRYSIQGRRTDKKKNEAVGPGAYKTTPFTERQFESKAKNRPRYTFSQAKRSEYSSSTTRNEGRQITEGAFQSGAKPSVIMKNSPRFSFGSATRDAVGKIGNIRTAADRGPMSNWQKPVFAHPVLPVRMDAIRYS